MSTRSRWVAIVGVVVVATVGCSGGDAGPPDGPAGTPTPVVTRSVAAAGEVATCPPGSRPDEPGPAAQSRPLLHEDGVSAALDARSGVVVVVDDIGATWTFDVCTNTWTKQATTGASPPHGILLVHDADSDLTYGFGDAGVVTYDVESAAWTARTAAGHELDGASGRHRVVLDPDRRTVYAYSTGTGELRSYDLARNRWARVEQGTTRPPVGVEAMAAFDASVGRIVLKILYDLNEPVAGPDDPVSTPREPVYGQTWTFDPATGTWVRVDTTTPELLYGWAPSGGEMTYDTTSRTSVTFAEGVLARFDAATGEWTTTTGGSGWPPAAPARGVDGPLVFPQPDGTTQLVPLTEGRLARTGHAVVDDVVNHRLLVLGGRVRDAADQPEEGSDAWAYDVATNTWTVVVPVQPD